MVFVTPLHDDDISREDFEEFGVNLMEPLTIRLNESNSIKFTYTAETTMLELKKCMEHQYGIPSQMQVIYKRVSRINNDVTSCEEHGNIIDILCPNIWNQINYEFVFGVIGLNGTERQQHHQSTIEQVKWTCLENDITMLKTITIKFVSGAVLGVIDMWNDETRKGVVESNVYRYVYDHFYIGEFDLCNEYFGDVHNTKQIDTLSLSEADYSSKSALLRFIMMNKSSSVFCENIDLIFIPKQKQGILKDDVFLDHHKLDLLQKIRLVFTTREDVVRVPHYFNLKGLKRVIMKWFGYAPDQQTLFHNEKKLEDERILLIKVSLRERMRQREDKHNDDDLVIRVTVKKPKTVQVRVICHSEMQQNQYNEERLSPQIENNEEGSSSFSQFEVFEVEDSLLGKDLRKKIEDIIHQQSEDEDEFLLQMEAEEEICHRVTEELLIEDHKTLRDWHTIRLGCKRRMDTMTIRVRKIRKTVEVKVCDVKTTRRRKKCNIS